MKKNKSLNVLKMFVAGILCFGAAYLSEPTLGAIATFPFIVILPAISYLIYRKALHIIGFTALASLIFKCAFVSDIPKAVIFALTCALYCAFAVVATMLLIAFRYNKNKKSAALSGAIFALTLAVYIALNGTVFGNLNAEKANIKFVNDTYPEETFTVGSTYYSPSDFCYVTEFIFTDGEVYSAKISAKKDGSAKINGYKDYCEARLLQSGTDSLRSFLSNYGYEGTDFALRRDRIETETLLVAGLNPESFYSDMCYEIAFYYEFSDAESFADMCKTYIGYIPDVFDYHSITFYGFGKKDKFEYSLNYINGSGAFEAKPFDKKSFETYSEDFETQKYWTMIK